MDVGDRGRIKTSLVYATADCVLEQRCWCVCVCVWVGVKDMMLAFVCQSVGQLWHGCASSLLAMICLISNGLLTGCGSCVCVILGYRHVPILVI